MTKPETTRRNELAARQSGGDGQPAASALDSLTGLQADSWLAAGKRAVSEFKNDFLQDRAAALTYYGIQAIFPGLLVLVTSWGCWARRQPSR